jgi:hypothetical protein
VAFKTIITCDRAHCPSKFEFPHEQCNVTTEDAWRAAESAGWSGLELDICPDHTVLTPASLATQCRGVPGGVIPTSLK